MYMNIPAHSFPIWILLLMLPTSMYGQRVSTFPNFSQLPGPVVRQVLQDEEGYMWYATNENGVCRDNGYQIDMFVGEEADGFGSKDRLVNRICLASDHRIFFATQAGAWVLDKHTYRIERLDTTVTLGRDVHDVVARADGSFWLTAGSWAYHFGKDRNLLKSYEVTEHGRHQSKINLFQDRRGHLWMLLHDGGLRRFNPRTDRFDSLSWDYAHAPLCMVEDTLHAIRWIGTDGGGIVGYSDDGHLTLCPDSRGTTDDEHQQRGCVFGLCQQGDFLWAAAIDNLYCYRIIQENTGYSLRACDTSHFLSARRKVLDCPYLDRSGNLWVPAYTPNPFVITMTADPISRFDVPQMEGRTGYPLIADILCPESDGFWLLQSRVGLMYYRPADEQLLTVDVGQPRQSLHARDFLIPNHRQGGVWTCLQNTIVYARVQGQRIITEQKADIDGRICSMSQAADGNLLVGTDDAVWRIQADGMKQRLATGLGPVSQLCQASDGRIYVLCGRHGLAQLTEQDKIISLSHQHNFDCMAPDPTSGHLWLSSPDGLVASFDTQTHQLHLEDLVSDHSGSVVKRLRVDQMGHVWLLTSRSVKEYNPQNHSFRTFCSTDANLRLDYFQDLCIEGKSVCFCGAGAICRTTTSEELEKQGVQNVVSVTDVTLDGVKRPLHFGETEIEVPAGVLQTLVHLSTFDPLHADKITFAYRLSDRNDAPWNMLPTGNNIVMLSQLSHGSYKLQVKATNEQGKWSEARTVLVIRQLPEWWKSWWAYTLYALLLLLLVAAAIRFYLRHQQQLREEQMEQRLTEMKFRFFTNVSHELRTPLTLIITPLTGLVARQPEGELRRRLSSILDHANELLQMINNLLSFRKLELNETRLNLRYGELNDYVRQAVDAFRPLCEKKGLTLHFQPHAMPLNLYFDKYIIHHVLFNLLSNAQKFTPAGGRVTVRLERTTVDADSVCITVADTGVGIAPDYLSHIFERFYQVPRTANMQQEGSGVGLNMVQELVRLHQGTVSVESTPGQGTTFSVRLPAILHIPTDSTAVAKSERSDERLTVLLAEDNDEFRRFVAAELANTYHVFEAADGMTALRKVQAEEVDVVVSDVMMPGIDGFELCRRLKSDEKTSHVGVILLTAWSAQESELEGYQAGADCYITKPFDIAILLNRLAQMEQKRIQRRQQLLTQTENPDVETLFTAKRDRQFMQRMLKLLDEHLSDERYGCVEVSADLCMSYTTAYRKIKTLTGLSPADFIRRYRLNQACQRLRSTDLPIATVAEQSGFSTPSYFTASFVKEFGKTPTEYRNGKQNSQES